MKQTIEVDVPEGFEAKFNPEEYKIELVKKASKPRTWEEYCKNPNCSETYYINNSSELIGTHQTRLHERLDRNLCASYEEAAAFLALMQLRQLRKAWVGDWEPDYSKKEFVWTVHVLGNNTIEVGFNSWIARPLSFPTEEMAQEFAVCFKDLLEQSKILI